MKIKNRLLLTCIIIAMIAFVACGKKNKAVDDASTEPSSSITPTTVESSQGTEPETAPEKSQSISETDAIKLVQTKIGDSGYYYETLDDDIKVGNNDYYLVQVSDSSSVIEPNLLIDKVSGEILCYKDDNTTAPFSEFPLYTADDTNNDSKQGKISKDDAWDMLSKVPKDTLKLEKSLKDYKTIEFDDWTTNVEDIECYGINVYEKINGQNSFVGVFYVATDGSKMFRYDSVDELFIEIK